MRIFQEDRKFKKRLFSTPVLGLLGALTVIVFISGIKVSHRAYVAYRGRAEAEAMREAAKREQDELDARIKRLESPLGIEKEAKERFNVKSPGEEVLVIVDPKQNTSSTEDGSAAGLWEFLKSFFE